MHDITVAGKVVLAHMQAADATRSYYYGCSTGGHQAYAEVQRYPTDFDGVVAGDPGNNRVALNAEFMNRFLAIHATNDNTTPLLTTAKVRLVTTAAIAACDALDGVTDGVIGDPRACTSAKFDVTTLACAPGATNTSSCLLPAELTAVQKIYAGPLNPATHTAVYPGPVVGSESGWASYWGETNTDAPGTTEPTRSDFWRFWVFNNPDWNWWTFDYNRDMTFAWGIVGPKVDQVNPDISAFKANGSKLITYQGWADPVVNPLDTIAYYNAVLAKQGSQAETDNFFRLFIGARHGPLLGRRRLDQLRQPGRPVAGHRPAARRARRARPVGRQGRRARFDHRQQGSQRGRRADEAALYLPEEGGLQRHG